MAGWSVFRWNNCVCFIHCSEVAFAAVHHANSCPAIRDVQNSVWIGAKEESQQNRIESNLFSFNLLQFFVYSQQTNARVPQKSRTFPFHMTSELLMAVCLCTGAMFVCV